VRRAPDDPYPTKPAQQELPADRIAQVRKLLISRDLRSFRRHENRREALGLPGTADQNQAIPEQRGHGFGIPNAKAGYHRIKKTGSGQRPKRAHHLIQSPQTPAFQQCCHGDPGGRGFEGRRALGEAPLRLLALRREDLPLSLDLFVFRLQRQLRPFHGRSLLGDLRALLFELPHEGGGPRLLSAQQLTATINL
jgi:hypothetical protein